MQHPQGTTFCAVVFCTVSVLLILILALGFKLFLNRIAPPLFVYWKVLSSSGLCIQHGSSPGMKVD